MKEYLNRKELTDGNIVLKMVKMGSDIDEETNYRIRGIVPTDDGKYLFVEIGAGHRFDYSKSYFPNMTKKEYLEKYPHELYVHCQHCFRADRPYDYYTNHTIDYIDTDRKCFYNLKYDKNGILEFFQRFNKNIIEVELVDKNYIDEYCDSMGFYKLYDQRLEYEYKPLKILFKNNKDLDINMKYTCYNYDKTVEYTEERKQRFSDYNIDELKEKYGDKLMTYLLEEYEQNLNSSILIINDEIVM